MSRQTSKSGSDSTTLQAGRDINIGLTLSEARTVAMDVFQANFPKLAKEADLLAKQRVEEIVKQFLSKLAKENPQGIEAAQDPDFQYALFTVQKEYAKSGDKELGDILIDLLVDRTKHDKRTILQIVLNESLSVVPKLTNDQLAALSIIFVFKYTENKGISNLPFLEDYLDEHVKPFLPFLTKKTSCYRHLAFAGCGSIDISEVKLEKVLMSNYMGLFSKGFTLEELKKREIAVEADSPLFLSCFHDQQKIQVNALSKEDLHKRTRQLGIDEQETKKIVELNRKSLMNAKEVETYLVKVRPYMADLFDYWNNSDMKHFRLTSIGISIGHANIKRQLGEFTDLSIWIN